MIIVNVIGLKKIHEACGVHRDCVKCSQHFSLKSLLARDCRRRCAININICFKERGRGIRLDPCGWNKLHYQAFVKMLMEIGVKLI